MLWQITHTLEDFGTTSTLVRHQQLLTIHQTQVDSNDELHIAVVDEGGGITLVLLVETHAGLSQTSDAKRQVVSSIYYVDYLYANSKYIYWLDHDSTLANAGSSKVGQTFDNAGIKTISVFSLSGALLDNEPTLAEMALAYDKFADPETEEVNFIIGGPSQGGGATADATYTHATKVIDIAEARKDCVAFISPARATL